MECCDEWCGGMMHTVIGMYTLDKNMLKTLVKLPD